MLSEKNLDLEWEVYTHILQGVLVPPYLRPELERYATAGCTGVRICIPMHALTHTFSRV